MKLASELSRETNGSPPKPIPGGYRWSEQNESAQFTTYSPEYHQKVVVVVSIFADGSAAVDFFGDEGTSETARYENVGHFTYSSRTDLPEMVKDIDWVWKTVDGYAASWQEDDGGEVDEARGPWKWTVKGSHSGKVLHANGYDITSSQKEWKRWNPVPPFAVWRGQELVGDGFTTLEDAKRAARQADEGGEVDEARGRSRLGERAANPHPRSAGFIVIDTKTGEILSDLLTRRADARTAIDDLVRDHGVPSSKPGFVEYRNGSWYRPLGVHQVMLYPGETYSPTTYRP